MNKGDYVIIIETGEIGMIATIDDDEIGVTMGPRGEIGTKFSQVKLNEIKPVSEHDGLFINGRNFSVQRFGVCNHCFDVAVHLRNNAKDGDTVECTQCRPGWCELYSTMVERDIRFLELKHGIELLDIYRKENRNKD